MAIGAYESGGMAVAYKAEAAVFRYRICKFGVADKTFAAAAAATDKLIGISGQLDTDINEDGDVWRSGIRKVIYGGVVVKGDLLTSDATGRAIATTTALNRIIGIAEISGVADDIGSCCITGGMI
jgi:hypothetical protein